MHPSLGLGNAREDAVQVLSRLFDIGLSGTSGIQFQGLELVAGFPLVGDGKRSQVELREGLHAVFPAGEVEHLDDALVREVFPVFGAAVPLGNPDAFLFPGDGITDILRSILAFLQEIPGRCNGRRPFDAEHLVASAHIDHQLSLHQIGPEGDFRGPSARFRKKDLQEGGIQHNIPVIGNEKIVLFGIQPFHPGDGQAAGGFFCYGVDDLVHHAGLELLYRTATAHQGRYGLKRHFREEETAHQRKILVRDNSLHRGRDFRIYIRSDIVKHAGSVYL